MILVSGLPYELPYKSIRDSAAPTVVGHGMSYVSPSTVEALLQHHDSGVRALAAAYQDLAAESERVCALGARWVEGGPVTQPYGRLLFDVINDEYEDGQAVADGDQDDVAEAGGEGPGLALVDD